MNVLKRQGVKRGRVGALGLHRNSQTSLTALYVQRGTGEVLGVGGLRRTGTEQGEGRGGCVEETEE